MHATVTFCMHANVLFCVRRYPSITWTPCTAHVLDLFLEDMGKMDFVSNRLEEAKKVVHFITNHHMSLALFRQHSRKLTLLKPAETRFAYCFIMLQRLLEVQDALDQTVACSEWKDWVKGNARPTREAAQEVREIIVRASFWRDVRQICDLLEPVIVLLRLTDGNTPCTGKVYNACYQISQHIEKSRLPSRMKEEVAETFLKRWNMLTSRVHCAGYALDPEFQMHDFSAADPEVMNGLMDMVERLVPDVNDQAEVLKQHTDYRQGLGVFGRPMAKAAAKTTPAYKWWLSYGGGAPLLQQVAVKVLGQVTSACACERNWSTFDFVHNKRRNKLKASRASDLVYVFSNLRLLDKATAVDFEEPMPEWGEETDPEDDQQGHGGATEGQGGQEEGEEMEMDDFEL